MFKLQEQPNMYAGTQLYLISAVQYHNSKAFFILQNTIVQYVIQLIK